ncbi:MAG TPA: hypothetical protein VFN66_09580 [Burkholderiales bacterium]|nr:hypothetical protein [Burkholderiales bacterium]
MNRKSRFTLLGICLASAFSNAALAAATTQAEANAQLNLIPVTATRQAAEQVLGNLVAAGVPVSQALEVVSDAVKHNYNASQLRQVGTGIGQQGQSVPESYAVKTADDAINANYPVARTLKALNSLRAELSHGKTPEQAYEAVSSGIANNTFDEADEHRSTGMAEANVSANAHLPASAAAGANAGLGQNSSMTANGGVAANALPGLRSLGGAGSGMHR